MMAFSLVAGAVSYTHLLHGLSRRLERIDGALKGQNPEEICHETNPYD